MVDLPAEALSVDHTTDLALARRAWQGRLLFGNLDTLDTLAFGTPDRVAEAAGAALEAGVDALWPGCDLHLETPEANLRAMVAAL